MPDLLLELFSEEIPARMQRQAADDLRRLVTDGLVAAGLTYEGAKAFATPRRLALTVHGVTARSPDMREEKKGPRVGAPERAIEGFLRSAGLTAIGEATVQSDPKKGDFYIAIVSRPGRAAEEIVAGLVPRVILEFPWPKSMRWGERSGPPYGQGGFGQGAFGVGEFGVGPLRWVRPLRSILCTFGPETEEPVVVPFEVAGVAAGNVTYGHRFMYGPEPIRVRRFDDYVSALEAAKVVLDPERRKAIVETEAKNLAFAQGFELVEDQGLLDEVAGLVEWPVVLMGRFDERFLDIPGEVIRLTIRQNQKCFVLRRASGGNLPFSHREKVPAKRADEGMRRRGTNPSAAPPHPSPPATPSPSGRGEDAPSRLTNRFILVANIEAKDGGKEIVAGNERVIAARLSDARFFWEQDLRIPLEEHAKKLEKITFHEKLGTQAERVERIARLAVEIADVLSAQPNFFFGKKLGADEFAQEQDYFRKKVRRASELCKADLTTAMVGEFPELQGVMGRYYALAQGEDPAVADAIRDHYKPQGPNDIVPTDPVSVVVALADKLDTLVGFWAIDEKPTGSKDPYALRRAALGAIRLILQMPIRVALTEIILHHHPATYQRVALGFRLLTRDQEGTFSYPGFWRDIPWPLISEDRDEVWPVEKFKFEPDEDVWVINEAIIPDREDDVLFAQVVRSGGKVVVDRRPEIEQRGYKVNSAVVTSKELLSFFADRLKVHLRETGARHDLIDAVFALPGQDDLLMIVRRVEALGKFLDSDDGKNLLVGYRRAANILRAEEKKDGEGAFDGEPDASLIARGQTEEKALHESMKAAETAASEAVRREDFSGAMTALAKLRPAVDAFFDKVTVNADDPKVRANRLKLLNQLRRATLAVADFSKIAG